MSKTTAKEEPDASVTQAPTRLQIPPQPKPSNWESLADHAYATCVRWVDKKGRVQRVEQVIATPGTSDQHSRAARALAVNRVIAALKTAPKDLQPTDDDDVDGDPTCASCLVLPGWKPAEDKTLAVGTGERACEVTYKQPGFVPDAYVP